MRQDNFEVLPGAFSGVRFNAPHVGDAGAQASAFGRAASGAGESMAAFALKMQQEVNGTRAQPGQRAGQRLARRCGCGRQCAGAGAGGIVAGAGRGLGRRTSAGGLA